MTKKRILSMARDQGSMQAIAPVIGALQQNADFDVHALAFDRQGRPYKEWDIRPVTHDTSDFLADPRGFSRDILRTWQPDLVLLGSSVPKGSVPNTPEQYLTAACHDAGVATVAVLDAWGFYMERFGDTSIAGLRFVPDVICALDRTCREGLCRAGVPSTRVALTHNPWLDRILASPAAHANDDRNDMLRVLFVSQPLLEHRAFRKWPYTQHELFCHVVSALRRLRQVRPVELRLWLHPSEERDRWHEHLSAAADIPVAVCDTRGPDIYSNVDVLVTSHSTVVYEALHLDVPCVNMRPGDPPLARGVTDSLGLTQTATSEDELAALLLAINGTSRARLSAMRLRLTEDGVFYSSGRATERVVAIIHSTLRAHADR